MSFVCTLHFNVKIENMQKLKFCFVLARESLKYPLKSMILQFDSSVFFLVENNWDSDELNF